MLTCIVNEDRITSALTFSVHSAIRRRRCASNTGIGPLPWDLLGQRRIRVHETTTTALREAGRPSGSRVVYATYGMNCSAHQTPQAARSGFHTTSRGPGIPSSIQLRGSHVGGSPTNVGSPQ